MSDPAEILEVRNEIAWFQADFCDISEPCAKSIVGAKGSGKTWIGARFIAEMVDALPGSKGIFGSSTVRQSEDIWEQDIQSLLNQLGWKYVWNKNEGIVRFWNRTILHIRTAEKPERIESIQYQWGWQDEVSLASKSFCKTIKSRIRGINGTGHARFTSMPDDPEHFIYIYLEGVCKSFHEVQLSDNPDKVFVANYTRELKEIYSGPELERYLNAKRVSLTGLGLFATDKAQQWDAKYNPKDDLYLVWDFNAEYRAVTAWQQQGLKQVKFLDKRSGVERLIQVPVYNAIQSFQMKEYTTADDARELVKHFRDHKGRIILNGDASGDNRTAAASESMWRQIEKVFKLAFPDHVRYSVPASNPNVKTTIQITNWALKNGLLGFSKPAVIAYRYLTAAKSDKYGEIDKKNDSNPDAPKSHEVDTIRYFANAVYERLWPGRSENQVKMTKLGGF